MSAEHEDQIGLCISPLGEYKQFAGEVLGWLNGEWGETPFREADLLAQEGLPDTLLATINGQPVGVLSYTWHLLPQNGEEELWINSLYVVESHRNKGVGERLVRQGVEQIKGSGRGWLYVYTDIPAFYQRLGWTRLNGQSTAGTIVLRYRSA